VEPLFSVVTVFTTVTMVTIVTIFAMMGHFSIGAIVAPTAQLVVMPEGYCRLPKVKTYGLKMASNVMQFISNFVKNCVKAFDLKHADGQTDKYTYSIGKTHKTPMKI
jgi:hypothetical protein